MKLVKNDPKAQKAVKRAALVFFGKSKAEPQSDQTKLAVHIEVYLTEQGRFIITTKFKRTRGNGKPIASAPATACFAENVSDIEAFLLLNDIGFEGELKADRDRNANYGRHELAVLRRPVRAWNLADRLIAYHALRQTGA